MQIDFKTAKSLCTDSEYALLQDARPKSLTQLSVPELRKKATRARTLSDKWRDLSRSQGNSSDGSAARSAQKQELFAEALVRFEGRLAKASGGSPPAKATAVVTKKAVAAKAAVKQTATKVVAKKAAKKAAKKSPASATMPKLPAAKKTSRKSQLPDHATKAEQHGRRSASRIAASGLSTRVRGHVSARGRRDQAARSSRKRS